MFSLTVSRPRNPRASAVEWSWAVKLNANTEEQLQGTLDSTYRNHSPLRTLWGLFGGRRRQLLLVVIFYVIKQSPVWVLPIVTGNIITKITDIYSAHKAGIAPSDPRAVGWIIFNSIVMFVLIAQNVPMHTLYASVLSSAVRHVQLVLRSALVVRLQQLSMSFHDNTQSGKLQSKILRDVEAVEGLARMLIENLLQGSIVLCVALGVTLSRRPSIAIFFAVTVPASIILTRLFSRKMRVRNEAFRREVEEMSGRVSEMIDMIPITRAHAVEGTEIQRLRRHLVRIRHSGQRMDMANNLFASCGWATFQCFQLICLLFNIWQCYRGSINPGDVVMYQGFFGMIVGAVQGMVNVMPQLNTGVESMRSIGEVLESPDIEHNDGKLAVAKVVGNIDFDAVGFRYPSATRPAVQDFSLKVQAGECIAVVGESGSGKSTLMNLIIGFLRPTEGRILLDGIDMSTINFRSFRRFLAVVPQQTVLFSGTVRENVTYGLQHVTGDRLAKALEMANCDFVYKLPKGLDTPIGSHGGKLSGGQRQRISIARALLRDPRIIILDEATSALDVQSEYQVQQAINRLIAGRTTFIVAHRLSTIRDATKVVVMKDGKMLESGTHDELLAGKESAFSQLHALQL
jgi:ATP-binding cassette subfamily B protein